ncbi:MAG: anti-sigma factor, partial [Acidimicrobiia bacterium]|nr:anti-sigma factor [Acidimicrobiia bacterium]
VDHSEVVELLGAYALNAVDSDESGPIGAHVDACVECAEELRQHLQVAALLSASELFAPAPIWDSIADELTDNGSPTSQPTSEPASPAPTGAEVIPLRTRWLGPLAVAAAFALLAGAVVVQSVRLSTATSDLNTAQAAVSDLTEALAEPALASAAQQALADPQARQVMLGSQSSGSNAIIVLMPDGTGYLAEHSLQPLPADRTYQLWAIIDGKVISAGILGPNPGVVPFHIDPEGFEGFAITEEVVGGVESSQNDPVVAWVAA